MHRVGAVYVRPQLDTGPGPELGLRSPGSGHDGIPSIGSWLLRGESGAITLSLGSLTRLRSNPFWSLIEQDVAGLVAQDLASGTAQAPR